MTGGFGAGRSVADRLPTPGRTRRSATCSCRTEAHGHDARSLPPTSACVTVCMPTNSPAIRIGSMPAQRKEPEGRARHRGAVRSSSGARIRCGYAACPVEGTCGRADSHETCRSAAGAGRPGSRLGRDSRDTHHFRPRQYVGRRLRCAIAKTISSVASIRCTTENGKPLRNTRRVRSFHSDPSLGCADARAVATSTDSRNRAPRPLCCSS